MNLLERRSIPSWRTMAQIGNGKRSSFINLRAFCIQDNTRNQTSICRGVARHSCGTGEAGFEPPASRPASPVVVWFCSITSVPLDSFTLDFGENRYAIPFLSRTIRRSLRGKDFEPISCCDDVFESSGNLVDGGDVDPGFHCGSNVFARGAARTASCRHPVHRFGVLQWHASKWQSGRR